MKVQNGGQSQYGSSTAFGHPRPLAYLLCLYVLPPHGPGWLLQLLPSRLRSSPDEGHMGAPLPFKDRTQTEFVHASLSCTLH